MNRRHDPWRKHLNAFRRLRRNASGDIYENALAAARVAVARVALTEAERVAGVDQTKASETIAPFVTPSLKSTGQNP